MTLEYYVLLRSVLKSKPEVRRCLKRCWHCRIFFLTDPRNCGRNKLGCPFGCQETHRKRESTRRSVAYYQDPLGKKKKRDLNQRRRRSNPESSAPQEPNPLEEECERWSEPMVAHVRLVVGLIEERQISRSEILQTFRKVLRQHRMARVRRIDHIINHLNEQPP